MCFSSTYEMFSRAYEIVPSRNITSLGKYKCNVRVAELIKPVVKDLNQDQIDDVKKIIFNHLNQYDSYLDAIVYSHEKYQKKIKKIVRESFLDWAVKQVTGSWNQQEVSWQQFKSNTRKVCKDKIKAIGYNRGCNLVSDNKFNIDESLVQSGYTCSKEEFVIILNDALNIAAINKRHSNIGLKKFYTVTRRKTLYQKVEKSLKSASKGNKKRYTKAINYYRAQMLELIPRPNIITRNMKWLWTVVSILIVAALITILLVYLNYINF